MLDFASAIGFSWCTEVTSFPKPAAVVSKCITFEPVIGSIVHGGAESLDSRFREENSTRQTFLNPILEELADVETPPMMKAHNAW